MNRFISILILISIFNTITYMPVRLSAKQQRTAINKNLFIKNKSFKKHMVAKEQKKKGVQKKQVIHTIITLIKTDVCVNTKKIIIKTLKTHPKNNKQYQLTHEKEDSVLLAVETQETKEEK
eukprot:59840_1